MISTRLTTILVALFLSVVALNSMARAADVQPSAGDTLAAIPEELTSEQIDDLLARLSDEDVRALLIRQLDKTAKAEEDAKPRGTAMDRLAIALNRAEGNFQTAISSGASLPQIPLRLWTSVTDGSDSSTFLVLVTIALFFTIGGVLEWLLRRRVLSGIEIDAGTGPTLGRKIKLSVLRTVIDIIAVLVFAAGTLLAWGVFELPTENANVLFSSVFAGVVILRLVAAVFRLFLSPNHPEVRLVHLDGADINGVYKDLFLVAALLIFLVWLPDQILPPLGFLAAETGLFKLISSAVVIACLLVLVWRPRPNMDPALHASNRNGRIFATIGILFFYVLALLVNFATGIPVLDKFIASLVILWLIPVIDSSLRYHASRLVAKEPEVELDHSADTESLEKEQSDDELPSYERVINTNIRILLGLIAVVALAEVWELDLIGILQSLVGETFAKILINTTITGLLVYAVWGIVNTAVARLAGPETEVESTPGDEGSGEGSRLGTLLPLFKKFVLITLIVMFALIVLSSLGVNIGPLIAGAGIVGIAIGFGAQTLVTDIISGLFFLLDDAFRVGEYVVIGDIRGRVEKISVRSLRLRHHNGPVHTIPFGQIQTLTNMSRDWAIMKFEIRVPFETDVEMVRKTVKKVGIKLMDHPDVGHLFLEPLKSQGVNRMDDSSFIIRCKFTSVPGQQYYIRRIAFASIQEAFEQKGIKFAPRRVIVETSSPDVKLDPQAAAAAAAAADSQQSQGPPPDEP